MEKEDLTVRAGVEEAREVWRGEDAYGLEDEQENLILDTVAAGEPLELLRGGCDVRSPCDDLSCGVLTS